MKPNLGRGLRLGLTLGVTAVTTSAVAFLRPSSIASTTSTTSTASTVVTTPHHLDLIAKEARVEQGEADLATCLERSEIRGSVYQ